MNENVNQTCNKLSATSLIIQIHKFDRRNGSEKDIPFVDEVVEEGSLEIPEGVAEKCVSFDPQFVLRFDAAEKEGVGRIGRTLEQLGGEAISGTGLVFDGDNEGEDTFVDVVSGGQRDECSESEGFTFADAVMRANLLSETVLEGVVSSSELPLC